MSKRVLKTLSLAERIKIIWLLDQNRTQVSLASQFSVGQAVISRIKRDKEKILEEWQKNGNPDRKRKRNAQAKHVDEALFLWFSEVSQERSGQVPSVSGPLLKEKAIQLGSELGVADFAASNGWLQRWKDRHGITFKREQRGEKRDEYYAGAELLPGIIKVFNPKDIFNADETTLYWKAIPKERFSSKTSNLSAGAKEVASKDNITVLLAANMDGSEKLEPLVIGASENPCCFENVQHMPVAYESINDASMTGSIWEEWLMKLDGQMARQNRNILMLCDHSAARTQIQNVCLTNVKLVFLQSNTTSLLQPMDRGIIANFKKYYRSLILRHLGSPIDGGLAELSLLEALHILRQAWNNIRPATIANCFRLAGFAFDSERVDENNSMLDDSTVTYVREKMDEGSESPDVDENDNDGPTGEAMSVTFEEALRALDTLRVYMEANGSESYDCLYRLQNSIRELNDKNIVKRASVE